MWRILIALSVLVPLPAGAGGEIGRAVEDHILPGYESLAGAAAALDREAARDCRAASGGLVGAYHAAFDAWLGVAHLRFGPAEEDNRAFSLAFWPDTRGAMPKTLASLIASEDPVVDDAAGFATVSVAGRGFYALELLLFDAMFNGYAQDSYVCRLVRAITGDIARITGEIDDAWRASHAEVLRTAGNPENAVYLSEDEALRALFTAVATGLQFNAEARLGRPLGTFGRPRPERAEARRSGRSLRNVRLSVAAIGELARALAADLDEDAGTLLLQAFERADGQAATLGDPIFAGVAEPTGRLRVEILQQRIEAARDAVMSTLGPALGIEAGFNAMDGD